MEHSFDEALDGAFNGTLDGTLDGTIDGNAGEGAKGAVRSLLDGGGALTDAGRPQ